MIDSDGGIRYTLSIETAHVKRRARPGLPGKENRG